MWCCFYLDGHSSTHTHTHVHFSYFMICYFVGFFFVFLCLFLYDSFVPYRMLFLFYFLQNWFPFTYSVTHNFEFHLHINWWRELLSAFYFYSYFFSSFISRVCVLLFFSCNFCLFFHLIAFVFVFFESWNSFARFIWAFYNAFNEPRTSDYIRPN